MQVQDEVKPLAHVKLTWYGWRNWLTCCVWGRYGFVLSVGPATLEVRW